MKKILLLLLIIGLSVGFASNQKYCTKISDEQRKTVIYLDLSSTNDKQFANEIFNNVSNNFLPHERVQIFTIDPQESSVKEVFNSCAPILTAQEIKKVNSESGLKYAFGGNPIEGAKEDYSFFKSAIKSTLAKVYKKSKKGSSDKKELIELLYAENSQFKNSAMSRVIILSDMIQNSEFVSNNDIYDVANISKVKNEYGIDFNNAEIYVYTLKKKLGASKTKLLKEFWSEYFESNNGYLKYFNDRLEVPKIRALYSKKFEGKIKIADKEYSSKILLNYDNKGKVYNSWIIINELDSIPLEGVVKKTSNSLSANLKVPTISDNQHKLFCKGQKVNLSLSDGTLQGTIKLDNTNLSVNGKVLKDGAFSIKMKEVEL